MPSRTLIVLALIVLAASSTSWAKKKHPGQMAADATLIAVSPTDITVQAGTDGQGNYKIDTNTKVTLDGLPSTPDALRAGMLVKVEVSPAGDTASSVTAKDAPRAVKKPKKEHTTTLWISN